MGCTCEGESLQAYGFEADMVNVENQELNDNLKVATPSCRTIPEKLPPKTMAESRISDPDSYLMLRKRSNKKRKGVINIDK